MSGRRESGRVESLAIQRDWDCCGLGVEIRPGQWRLEMRQSGETRVFQLRHEELLK